VINQTQKIHGSEYISYHQKSQNLTHGGGWEGQNPAKCTSEENTQSTSRKGHEKCKVQKTDSKGLQTGYLGHPHTLKSRKGLTKT
jgi:hypothetical protein